MEDAWEKELCILSLLKQAENTEVAGASLARYKWHCTAKQHSITGIVPQELQEIKNSALICFDYVPNKCLHDYLENKEPLTFRIVCSLCIDIISTIEYLQTCGISNNNINSRAIVVRRTGSQDSPVKAVIVDFSRAMKLQKYEDGSYAKADILQFRFLFRVLLRNCPEDCSPYQQIDDILSLCKYERKVDTAESIKYCLTSALMDIDETFNTKL
ncbi:uncharacterized protein LOC110247072 [Exaiptasia diaphana]|uniref:Protein kinase domain-containing protein n=1 Tax=Exaiptasia diaphana TaxID=2652724 RepID=A0A913XSN9_EXADI|nr:uncharacterized protein LOC110247072 [Exaiptasia diaphana]